MPKDAIVLLKEDHREVEKMFKRFEKLGDGATTSKRDLVDRIIAELAGHAAIEEQIFYPACRHALPDDDPVLEALEEHHVLKWTLSELDGMDPEAERFDAKCKVMMDMVRHHVEEEEGELFPQMRDAIGRKQMQEIGDAMIRARKVAPTKPHPRMPDEPPANVMVGAPTAVADRMVDLTKDTLRKITRR